MACPIPTWLLRNCVHDIIPVLTTIVNMSLRTGVMPSPLTTLSSRCVWTLPAAFDTDVMLHRLSHDVTVVQNAVDWFKSYLSDRVQFVEGLSRCCTRSAVILHLCSNFIKNLRSHFYADDTQIYIAVKSQCIVRRTLMRLLSALNNV